MKNTILLFMMILNVFISVELIAQDTHSSHMNNYTFFTNPSLFPLYNNELLISINGRSKWGGLKNGPAVKTFAANIGLSSDKVYFVSGLLNDTYLNQNYNNYLFQSAIGYYWNVSDRIQASLAFGMLPSMRQYNFDGFSFPDEWDNQEYNFSLPTKESSLEENRFCLDVYFGGSIILTGKKKRGLTRRNISKNPSASVFSASFKKYIGLSKGNYDYWKSSFMFTGNYHFNRSTIKPTCIFTYITSDNILNLKDAEYPNELFFSILWFFNNLKIGLGSRCNVGNFQDLSDDQEELFEDRPRELDVIIYFGGEINDSFRYTVSYEFSRVGDNRFSAIELTLFHSFSLQKSKKPIPCSVNHDPYP